MHTDPEITRIIIGTLRNGHTSKFRTLVSEETSKLIQEAVDIQDRQNRLQFHKRRLAVQWGQAQEIYFNEMYGHTRRRQTRWAIQFVNRINKFNMELWNVRNQVAAEAAKIHVQAEERIHLERLIRETFDKGINGIRPIDQHNILNTNVEEVLKLSNKERQAWLNMIETVRKRHDRSQQSSMSSMRAVIDNWIIRHEWVPYAASSTVIKHTSIEGKKPCFATYAIRRCSAS